MKNTEIKAVAFDIDGTIYPDWRLYIRIAPYFFKNLKFFLSYNKVRKILHRTAPLCDLFEYQARLLADFMKITSQEARSLIDEKIYCGIAPYFDRIKTFPYVEETFRRFKEAGLKIAILSDFPPKQKGRIWGLIPYCDLIMGSEECGALKPSIYTFGTMAEKLGVENESILYVGNSIRADVKGANDSGMISAYKMPFWRKILHKPLKEADYCFSNYRQLQKFVLDCKGE